MISKTFWQGLCIRPLFSLSPFANARSVQPKTSLYPDGLNDRRMTRFSFGLDCTITIYRRRSLDAISEASKYNQVGQRPLAAIRAD